MDEKIYKIKCKDGSHLSSKTNPDGSKTALQFDNSTNALKGPVNLVEVDKDELYPNRTFKDIILEDVVAPILLDTAQKILDVGIECAIEWTKTTAIPKASQTIKKAKNSISSLFQEPKVNQVIAENKGAKIVKSHPIQAEQPQITLSPDELSHVINSINESALKLAACIRILSNSIIQFDTLDDEKKLEVKSNYNALITSGVMSQITLLLEDKNSSLLDDSTAQILSAFKNGNVIKEGIEVPIINYLE